MQEINADGSRGPIEKYSPKKLIQALNKPEVKEVRVFRLEKGMVVEIKGKPYEVLSLNSKGKKAVLQLVRVYRKGMK